MKDIVIINSSISQYKGNIHMHSTRSDGKFPPEITAEKYRLAGYDFIMMSDHEIYWNSNKLDKPDFLVLGGTEIALKKNPNYFWTLDYYSRAEGNIRAMHKHMHYCCIKDESIPDVGQYFEHDYTIPRIEDRGIDSWNEQVNVMRRKGNIVIVNHPHWSRLSPEFLLATQGIVAIEIFNSGNVYKCAGRSDEDIWDWCLMRGRKLLAVAADDSHECTTDFARGFTMVQCETFTKSEICKAFKSGNFYASCGPLVKEMKIVDGVLKMKFSPVVEARITGYDRDGFNIPPCGNATSLEELEWPVNTTMRYFRVELIDAKGQKAWLQPIFVEDLL